MADGAINKIIAGEAGAINKIIAGEAVL